MRQKLKLGHRLKTIKDIVTTHNDFYDRIWDTCCDHGLLGASLIEAEISREVVFVDIVPALVDDVLSKLTQHYADSKVDWQTMCVDVAKLPLDTPFCFNEHDTSNLNSPNTFPKKQLVIIAGVGGDLMADFVESLTRRNNSLDVPLRLDFLLCPVHHLYTLRTTLRDLKFKVLNEQLIKENNRFYEVMLVTNDLSSGKTVTLAGEDMWEYKNEGHRDQLRQYLTKTLGHYSRIQNSRAKNTASIIAAYEAVEIKKTPH